MYSRTFFWKCVNWYLLNSDLHTPMISKAHFNDFSWFVSYMTKLEWTSVSCNKTQDILHVPQRNTQCIKLTVTGAKFLKCRTFLSFGTFTFMQWNFRNVKCFHHLLVRNFMLYTQDETSVWCFENDLHFSHTYYVGILKRPNWKSHISLSLSYL